MKRKLEPHEAERFTAALRRFDEENAQDPHNEPVPGGVRPRELAYAEWLTSWVNRLEPEPSEELLLAARSQHICRWMIPRDSYPMTRAGYLKWREELRKFHAEKAGNILREVKYPEETIIRVQTLILKKLFPKDRESRTLEDALCLVFLEHQLSALAQKATDEKLVNALQKSWKKMTPQAREIALTLPYGAREGFLVQKAITPEAHGENQIRRET